MKYNNVIFLGLCLGLTTYSALSADSVIKISGRVLDYGCTVSSDSLNFTVDLQKNRKRVVPYSYISMLTIIPLYILCIIAITNPNNSFPHRISR